MFAAENGLKGDPRLKGISDSITVVPHFPKPGTLLFHFINLCVYAFPFFFLDFFDVIFEEKLV